MEWAKILIVAARRLLPLVASFRKGYFIVPKKKQLAMHKFNRAETL
jgi:hypothetical protein